MFYVHDRHNDESKKELATLDKSVTVVDYWSNQELFRRIKGLKEIPCYLEKLELVDSNDAQYEKKLTAMASKMEKMESQLRAMQAQQQEQQALIVECFTDLDAALIGGESNGSSGSVA